jgi:hypothetical protein
MPAVVVPHFTLRKMVDSFIDETRLEWAKTQTKIRQ